MAKRFTPPEPGTTYNYLTVVSFYRAHGGRNATAYWLFKCDCGKEKIADLSLVQRGHIKSCGCYRKAYMAAKQLKHGHYIGNVASPTYVSWQAMLARCKDPTKPSYSERGINVCSSWWKFEEFLLDMGERPSLAHRIERVDNNGSYEKENCRWATHAEQMQNTQRNPGPITQANSCLK